MLKSEVVIVGGGPAGSICAYELARAGKDVVLLERSVFPRTKVCGEYLNAGAVRVLREIGFGEVIGAHSARLRGIRLHTHGLAVELPFSQESWSLARAELDALLLDRARIAGAQVVTAHAESVERTSGGMQIGFRDTSGTQGKLEAGVIVGADGIGSLVARECGLASRHPSGGRFALGGHYAGFTGLDEYIEMYVDGKTYFAINPLPNDLANVMVIVDELRLHEWSGAIDARMQDAARELGAGRRSVDGVRRIGKRVAIGPLQHRTQKVADRGVYLIGDAAGFIDPFTGQGVFLALESGRLAAQAIAGELSGSSQGRAYARDHARIFRGRRRLASFVSMLVKTPWLARRAARNLDRSPALREHLMESIAGVSDSGAFSPGVLLRLVS